MARIAGVNLPRNKRMEIALTYIFGIGRRSSGKLLDKAGVSRDKRSDDLDEQEVRRIRDVIEAEHKVEGDLRREVIVSRVRRYTTSTSRVSRLEPWTVAAAPPMRMNSTPPSSACAAAP